MHDHLPLLLNKGSALLRDLGHFVRQFTRVAGLGLVTIRAWPGIFSGKTIQKGEMPGHTRNSNHSGIADRISNHSDKQKLIISVHVPKTGGSSFVKILRKCAEEVLYLDYDRVGAPPVLLRRKKPLTVPFDSIVDDLESLPGRSVIHGHFAPKKYSGRFPNAVYVTWLRDPVERVVSHYLYWQRTNLPGDPLWEQVVGQKLSLEQFAQLAFARDVYFRWFSPLGVERFDFVGIMEEYDRSLELFRRLICPDAKFRMTVKNRNPNREGNFYDLGPELRRKILELNQRDAYVYLDGVRRFRSLCAQVGI